MAVGIIAEYNPFHKGHLYHLAKTKEAFPNEPVIIAMSGNFVARGEPAIAPASIRAKWALDAGANLVLELPSVFVLQNANVFAREMIRLLSSFSISHLSFGAMRTLDDLLSMRDEEETKKDTIERIIRRERKKGASLPQAYAQARKEALRSMLRLDPNDLLALMYLKYLPSGVMPYTVTRIGASHDSQDHDAYPSALKIRRDLLMGKMPDLPEDVKNDLIGRQLFSQDHVIPLLKYSLAFDSDDPSILHYENGLADRLRKTEADTFDAWVSKAASKRYTHSRIRRYIYARLANLRPVHDDEIYTRVLAMDAIGRRLLKNTSAHMITHGKSIGTHRDSPTVQAMLRTSFLSDILLERPVGSIYRTQPIVK